MEESSDVSHFALGLMTDGVVVVASAGDVVKAAPVEAGQFYHQLIRAKSGH